MRFVRSLSALLLLSCVAVFPGVAAAQGGAATDIDLTVTGGPHAGTYAASSDAITCSYGLVGDDSWGNQYSVVSDDPTVFSSLQLIVPSATAAAGGTTEFITTVSFGAEAGYTIDGRPGAEPRGEGTVTLEDHGDSAVVTLVGTTAEGIGIDAVIDCHRLLRAESGAAGEDDDPVTGSFDLTVAGESFAGDIRESQGDCSQNYGEEGDLFFSYLDEDHGGEGLYQIDLLAYDLQEALGGSPNFYLSLNDQQVYIDTSNADGSGTVTVRPEGDGFVISIDADADGTPVEGTISCSP